MMDHTDFIRESNRIEGIKRAPTAAEIAEHVRFVGLGRIAVGDLQRFVKVYQPDAVLRDREDLNVRVGSHIAPPGGLTVVQDLRSIIAVANDGMASAYHVHCGYETLHPFTDGNGRSGRALWAWQMLRQGGCPLGFLHHFYYQALQGARG